MIKFLSKAILFSFIMLLLHTIVYAQTTYEQSSGTVTLSGNTYSTSTQDQSAVKVTGGTLTLSNCKVSSTGNTSSNDNSSFYGLNAVILAYTSSGPAVINSSGNAVSSTGTGANGIFAYGKATITTTGDKFKHTGDGGHAIMCSGGGTITVEKDTAVTSGQSSSVLATDRGGGTIYVTGGKYTAGGSRSAALYSTGTISCTEATLIANGAEALVIEGSNNIVLNNCIVKTNYDKWGALIYQSSSGDADGTDGYLTMTGGSFSYSGKNGGMFYNTNSTAYITLIGVSLSNSCDTLIRCIKGSWGGSSASSGEITHFTTESQTASGLIHVDANSEVYISFEDASSFSGAINKSNTAKLVTLTMDATSSWTVTANSHINGLITNPGISGTSVSNITGNGYNVYYTKSTNTALNGLTYTLQNGGYLLPEGATAVTEIEADNILKFSNYPNPFSDQITVSLYLPQSSDVKLKVYDISGKLIQTFEEGTFSSGSSLLSLNLDNLCNGEYLIEMIANNQDGTISRKSSKIIKK